MEKIKETHLWLGWTFLSTTIAYHLFSFTIVIGCFITGIIFCCKAMIKEVISSTKDV
ncbi:hypothetical protein [Bacillus suaedaesalsae]|uniref:Uncharacterized protein n=1 Tax=Bacillus suaedaesalsae TaxID=2810349 RepID=A0ABS2DG13_9BACI|nr:hypothetical protein [Bacillus suaedaesalsae]MBM6617421.1 hypothetical protein [Bacillus suaedaesalsae]